VTNASKVPMMSSTSPVAPSKDGSAHVDVSVPLRSEFASIVRLVTASLGADAGFTVDDIDDLRLAMSEVFSALVDASAGDSESRVAIKFGTPSDRGLDDTRGGGLAVTLTTTDPAHDVVFDDLASAIIRVAVDAFEFDGTSARLVKFADEQSVDQSAP
jgi:hypothetical protein